MESYDSPPRISLSLHINVSLDDQARECETRYKIKRTAPLKNLMDEYANRLGVNVKVLRFLYDERHLKGSDTPKMLELEDGAVITVCSEQSGGGATATATIY